MVGTNYIVTILNTITALNSLITGFVPICPAMYEVTCLTFAATDNLIISF